ncbi:YitT family protein [Ligilactobacillus equi]|uniref:DUF2179 domain-containing protein n=3 Tax=Ligilactobacillus equi TaxID=137357 RepID=V7HTC1_9LACO|nr:YitT family protein [Ligilactobacillus equi]ETA73162.1 hypothetical protein LEQ_2167 [Ligilactobacillus equi DPC 6820]
MDELQRIWRRHTYMAKISTAIFYGILVSVAMNFFWTPGKVYSSGITGLAQLLVSLLAKQGWHLSAGLFLFILNVPLFILAWLRLGRTFTIFTIIAVFSSSLMIKILHPLSLTTDPIICAIFGGCVNGFGTGLALRNGISTGGLDILGLTIRKKTGKSIGSINLMFNFLIVIAAGMVYGWPHAFYSALGIFINAHVIDMTFTRQQLLQVMIITDQPKGVVDCLQNSIHHGITVLNHAQGAYTHKDKSVLITIISRYEVPEMRRALAASDSKAFVSISPNIQVLGNYRDFSI